MIDPRIIGIWRIKSTKSIDDNGNVLPPPYGPTPAGETRQFMSYVGNYTFDCVTLTTRVDAASDASRIGGDQVRSVRFENGGMMLAPPRRLYAGVMQCQELFWQRVG